MRKSKDNPFANLKKPLMNNQNPNSADIYEEDGENNQVDSLATHRYTIIKPEESLF